MDLPQIDDYRSLFLNQTPLLDVRAPVEFSQGAFPFAENFPLINDKERETIGIKYKNMGQDEAIKLGHNLVQGDIKEERVNHWQSFFDQYPQGVLYCFRGGMRSKISQQWIYEKTGIIFPRVKGGYKAMRRYLIDELENSVENIQPIMLGGRTGIGKTILLDKLKQQIDLEGLFHHRGSVFGKHVTAQPSQIDIENNLSISLIRHLDNQVSQIVFEDEAPNIGSRRIPEILYNKMQQSPLIQLEATVDERINITFHEYIIEALAEHQQHYGDDAGFEKWSMQLIEAIDKIQRRLGGVRHKQLKSLLTYAIDQQRENNITEFHRDWIKSLLVDYYDPMYDYQFSKKVERVVFKGSHNEVLEFLSDHYHLS
ncbi:MAG: tRNA 2-selenouridine(34) synthase MnmH [endosymbiont of Galathealinum brachiosum]|uniref:tRNA 2-selenouridine synthase n=1 Tax=endosymbiont of Galathealinum brachiosum TaxID=2200906 RepID=A0A370DEG7_9GAMM|nr:MAG: tRNA 2-selenouridine(34) synthase MnmH [endosymbiont of Galathealinum brachiosum]